MNDLQLLRDLEELKNNIENTFNGLLSQAKQLLKEAQKQETTIQALIQEHQKDIEQVNGSIEAIGGSKKLEILLTKIEKTYQLLSQYSNINDLAKQNIINYQELNNEIQQQLNQCSIARDSLKEAYEGFEDLQSFCNQLLEIRQFVQSVSERVNIINQKLSQLEQQYQQETTDNQSVKQQFNKEFSGLVEKVNNFQKELDNKIGKKAIVWCMIGSIVGSSLTISVFLSWLLPTWQNRTSEPSKSLIETN